MTNSLAVANFLESDPRVEKVNHPLLKSHAQNSRAITLFKGRHSGMVSCVLKGTEEQVNEFLLSLKVSLIVRTFRNT